MTTKEKAEKLEIWGDLENTELGEVWYKLIELYLYRQDYITDEFHLQLGVEIEVQYQYALDMIEDGDIVIE